jgi:CubicO group peptidase (beta-lactamase class C family)
MADPPGTQWAYCNAVSHLLSAIVAESTGMTLEDFARVHLFEPLGIGNVVWATDPQGHNVGYAHLSMRPHDLAKLGYLYLHGGEWDGQQVLPRDWIAASITPGVAPDYGYQWWVGPSWYYASGYGGQRLYVFPSLDLMVVTTAGMGGLDPSGVVGTLLIRYVLPAIESDGPLPADPDGQAALASASREAATPLLRSESIIGRLSE